MSLVKNTNIYLGISYEILMEISWMFCACDKCYTVQTFYLSWCLAKHFSSVLHGIYTRTQMSVSSAGYVFLFIHLIKYKLPLPIKLMLF